MMAATHVFVSLAVASLLLPRFPAEAGTQLVLASAVVGGTLPDLDLAATHRRTLHFPVGYSLLAAVFALAVSVSPSSLVAVLAVGTGTAALHSVSDVLGGSAEPAPWDPSTECGVYNHVLGGWHSPRRLVRYSGAPEDFSLGVGFALVAVTSPVTTPTVDAAALSLLCLSAIYTVARRRMVGIASRCRAFVPRRVRALIGRCRVREIDGGGSTIDLRLRP